MDIGLISIPPIETKKKHDRILPFSSSTNYGLLSIATYLTRLGFSSKVFDPIIWENEATIGCILEWVRNCSPKYLALSCISGFSYPALKILSREIKKTYPDIPIIAGGKDHLALIANKAIYECPEVDVIVLGEGELPLAEILESGFSSAKMELLEGISHIVFKGQKEESTSNKKESSHGIENLQPLDFSLYENFYQHPPCIEVGRGCPYRCSFCPNDKQRVLKKPPKEIILEAKQLAHLYNLSNLFLYFQTPIFLMSDEELINLKYHRDKSNLNFTWRTQTRVDYLSTEKLKLINKAGGRVIDLGLESGSEEMLAAMQKTSSPTEYLSKASAILFSAYEENITLKINILFYAGERRKTLLDTFKFLENHSGLNWTLSAYPLLIYPGTLLENSIDHHLKTHGGSKICSQMWNERGLIPINPSNDFNYEEMQRLGVLFGKSFQTAEKYFSERRYGYYRPNVAFDEFQAHIESVELDLLPFSKNEDDMFIHRNILRSILDGNYANSSNWS